MQTLARESIIAMRNAPTRTISANELFHLLNCYGWRRDRLINATNNTKTQGTEK